MRRSFTIWLLILFIANAAHSTTFYIDRKTGNDADDGLSRKTAWRTLKKASGRKYRSGDRLLLRKGCRFTGKLLLQAKGTAEDPVIVRAYDAAGGNASLPAINAKGFLAGVHLRNCHHVVLQDIEITADGGEPLDRSNKHHRYGVYVQATGWHSTSHITLKDLFIHDIYPAAGSESEGRNPTTHKGTAIAIRGSGKSSDFLVEDCRIERTGFKAIAMSQIRQVKVLNNRMKDIGGPAIQPGRVDGLIVRGNIVDGSGSYIDPRMHGRGSGIWPWTSNRVLIEKNTFMHARGKADSCGVHIDFNCKDVIVQYNLSYDNEGGFIEILGNNYNCAYRYNISINDGARVKGKNGAHQEGKVLWTSGFVGKGKKKEGPFSSYIYNNTIYVGENSRSCFSIAPTTKGLLIANNIFHIAGRTENVLGDQDLRTDKRVTRIPGAMVKNNVYLNRSVLPATLPVREQNMIIGDCRFANPGSSNPADYIPRNEAFVRNKGIPIHRLAGDPKGIKIGLRVRGDFFGNPITGLPDLGAVEIPQQSSLPDKAAP
ncbi:MAG: right-handed parallel beta-helix repeat-containing protein [Planctomycetota bacterium]